MRDFAPRLARRAEADAAATRLGSVRTSGRGRFPAESWDFLRIGSNLLQIHARPGTVEGPRFEATQYQSGGTREKKG